MREWEQCAFEALLHHMVRVKQFFFVTAGYGCCNFQSCFFAFCLCSQAEPLLQEAGEAFWEEPQIDQACWIVPPPWTLGHGHASYKTTTQDSLSMADRKIQWLLILANIPTKLVFTTCARMSSLKQVNLEQLNEASMMTTQTDSVARFPNISMSFQDGSSTLLQDRGRVRRDPVSWLASPWTADLQKIIPDHSCSLAWHRKMQKVPEGAAWNLCLTAGVVCCCRCRLLSASWEDPLDALGSSHGLQGLPCGNRLLWEARILRSWSKADRTPQWHRVFVRRSFKMNEDEMFCNVIVCSTQFFYMMCIYIYII